MGRMTVLIDRGGGTKRPPPPDKKSPFSVLLYYGLRFAQTYPSSCHNEAAGEGKAPPPPPTHPPIFHFLLLSLPSSVRAVNSVLHDKAAAAATLFSGGWIEGAANGEGMGEIHSSSDDNLLHAAVKVQTARRKALPLLLFHLLAYMLRL